MLLCPHCGQKMPETDLPKWKKDWEKDAEARRKWALVMREPDPLSGLPANARKALATLGADAPEKIARALQYRLLSRQTRGIGDRTYRRIEKWLEGRGLLRVSEDENFFWKGSKKTLT